MDVRKAAKPGEGTAQGQGLEVKNDICPEVQKLGKCLLFAVAHTELGPEATMEAVLEGARALCGRMAEADAQDLLVVSIADWPIGFSFIPLDEPS